MRHPVIITSLEEDFREIGILPREEAKQPEPDPTPNADEEVNEDEDDLSEEELAQALEGVEISEENLEEIFKRIKSFIRGGKKVKVKHHLTNKEKMAAKKQRKSAAGRKAARRAEKKRKSAKGKKHAGLLSRWRKRLGLGEENETSNRIASLLEDVQEIISTVDDDSIENATKSFANVAIISEMLARVFEAVKDEFEEDDAKELGEASEFFGQLAEEAAGIATLLHEGVDEDTPEDEIPTYEDIEAKFQEHMDALIDGLELYADITEDEDEEDPTEEATEDEDEED